MMGWVLVVCGVGGWCVELCRGALHSFCLVSWSGGKIEGRGGPKKLCDLRGEGERVKT